jgi:hypothetical protein
MMPEVTDAVGALDEDAESQDAFVDRLTAGLALRAARPGAFDDIWGLGFRGGFRYR